MYNQPYQFGTPQPAQPQAIVVEQGPRHHHHHHRRNRSRSSNGHRRHHHHHHRPRRHSFNNSTSVLSSSPYPYATNGFQQPQPFIPGPQIAAPQPQILTAGQGAYFTPNIDSGQAYTRPLAPHAGYGYDYRHHHHHHLFHRSRSVPYLPYASQGTAPMVAGAGPIMGQQQQQQVYPTGYQYAGGVGGYGVQNGTVPVATTGLPIQTATTGYGGAYGGVPTATSVVV